MSGQDMLSGWVVVLIGVVFCFAGVVSTHLLVLLSGFGLGWLLGDVFGASPGVGLLIGLGVAVVAWVVVNLVLKSALFFVGGLLGAVIGARLYSVVLEPSGGNVVVAVVFVLAVGAIGAWLTARSSRVVLAALTALGGAGLIISGLSRAVDSLSWLRTHDTPAQATTVLVLWLGLAVLGWLTQRRMTRRDSKT